jgi:hypothetical protein
MAIPPFKNVVSIIPLPIPHAMIDGIRRRFARSVETDPWNAEQELAPEVEDASQVPTDTAVLLAGSQASSQAAPGFSPSEGDLTNYYRGIMRTAIENGGKYREHQIPVPWLRMILAGLESRHIGPDKMWYEVDFEEPVNPLPEIPSYEDLFPSNRDVPTGPR